MRNIFFQKSYTKCAGEFTPRTFYKKQKLSGSIFSGSTIWNIIKFVFIVCPSRGLPKYNILKSRCWPLVSTLHKAFLKEKRGLKLVSLPHFLHNFWRKMFITLYFINWSNFVARLLLLLETLDIMCIVINYYPVCDVMNFQINYSFWISIMRIMNNR